MACTNVYGATQDLQGIHMSNIVSDDSSEGGAATPLSSKKLLKKLMKLISKGWTQQMLGALLSAAELAKEETDLDAGLMLINILMDAVEKLGNEEQSHLLRTYMTLQDLAEKVKHVPGEQPLSHPYTQIVVNFWESLHQQHLVLVQTLPGSTDHLLTCLGPRLFKSALSPSLCNLFRLIRCKALNGLLERCSSRGRGMFRSSNRNAFNKLPATLEQVGDYDFQTSLVESIFRLSGCSERSANVTRWFPQLPCTLQALFTRIVDFDPDCRRFLNAFNNFLGPSRLVHTYAATSVTLGCLKIVKPNATSYEQLWVDFNLGSESVSVLCDTADSEKPSPDRVWETVIVYTTDVLRGTLQRTLHSDTLCLMLSKPARDYFSSPPSVTSQDNSAEDIHDPNPVFRLVFEPPLPDMVTVASKLFGSNLQIVLMTPKGVHTPSAATPPASLTRGKVSVTHSFARVSRMRAHSSRTETSNSSDRADSSPGLVLSRRQRSKGSSVGARKRPSVSRQREAPIFQGQITGTITPPQVASSHQAKASLSNNLVRRRVIDKTSLSPVETQSDDFVPSSLKNGALSSRAFSATQPSSLSHVDLTGASQRSKNQTEVNGVSPSIDQQIIPETPPVDALLEDAVAKNVESGEVRINCTPRSAYKSTDVNLAAFDKLSMVGTTSCRSHSGRLISSGGSGSSKTIYPDSSSPEQVKIAVSVSNDPSSMPTSSHLPKTVISHEGPGHALPIASYSQKELNCGRESEQLHENQVDVPGLIPSNDVLLNDNIKLVDSQRAADVDQRFEDDIVPSSVPEAGGQSFVPTGRRGTLSLKRKLTKARSEDVESDIISACSIPMMHANDNEVKTTKPRVSENQNATTNTVNVSSAPVFLVSDAKNHDGCGTLDEDNSELKNSEGLSASSALSPAVRVCEDGNSVLIGPDISVQCAGDKQTASDLISGHDRGEMSVPESPESPVGQNQTCLTPPQIIKDKESPLASPQKSLENITTRSSKRTLKAKNGAANSTISHHNRSMNKFPASKLTFEPMPKKCKYDADVFCMRTPNHPRDSSLEASNCLDDTRENRCELKRVSKDISPGDDSKATKKVDKSVSETTDPKILLAYVALRPLESPRAIEDQAKKFESSPAVVQPSQAEDPIVIRDTEVNSFTGATCNTIVYDTLLVSHDCSKLQSPVENCSITDPVNVSYPSPAVHDKTEEAERSPVVAATILSTSQMLSLLEKSVTEYQLKPIEMSNVENAIVISNEANCKINSAKQTSQVEAGSKIQNMEISEDINARLLSQESAQALPSVDASMAESRTIISNAGIALMDNVGDVGELSDSLIFQERIDEFAMADAECENKSVPVLETSSVKRDVELSRLTEVLCSPKAITNLDTGVRQNEESLESKSTAPVAVAGDSSPVRQVHLSLSHPIDIFEQNLDHDLNDAIEISKKSTELFGSNYSSDSSLHDVYSDVHIYESPIVRRKKRKFEKPSLKFSDATSSSGGRRKKAKRATHELPAHYKRAEGVTEKLKAPFKLTTLPSTRSRGCKKKLFDSSTSILEEIPPVDSIDKVYHRSEASLMLSGIAPIGSSLNEESSHNLQETELQHSRKHEIHTSRKELPGIVKAQATANSSAFVANESSQTFSAVKSPPSSRPRSVRKKKFFKRDADEVKFSPEPLDDLSATGRAHGRRSTRLASEKRNSGNFSENKGLFFDSDDTRLSAGDREAHHASIFSDVDSSSGRSWFCGKRKDMSLYSKKYVGKSYLKIHRKSTIEKHSSSGNESQASQLNRPRTRFSEKRCKNPSRREDSTRQENKTLRKWPTRQGQEVNKRRKNSSLYAVSSTSEEEITFYPRLAKKECEKENSEKVPKRNAPRSAKMGKSYKCSFPVADKLTDNSSEVTKNKLMEVSQPSERSWADKTLQERSSIEVLRDASPSPADLSLKIFECEEEKLIWDPQISPVQKPFVISDELGVNKNLTDKNNKENLKDTDITDESIIKVHSAAKVSDDFQDSVQLPQAEKLVKLLENVLPSVQRPDNAPIKNIGHPEAARRRHLQVPPNTPSSVSPSTLIASGEISSIGVSRGNGNSNGPLESTHLDDVREGGNNRKVAFLPGACGASPNLAANENQDQSSCDGVAAFTSIQNPSQLKVKFDACTYDVIQVSDGMIPDVHSSDTSSAASPTRKTRIKIRTALPHAEKIPPEAILFDDICQENVDDKNKSVEIKQSSGLGCRSKVNFNNEPSSIYASCSGNPLTLDNNSDKKVENYESIASKRKSVQNAPASAEHEDQLHDKAISPSTSSGCRWSLECAQPAPVVAHPPATAAYSDVTRLNTNQENATPKRMDGRVLFGSAADELCDGSLRDDLLGALELPPSRGQAGSLRRGQLLLLRDLLGSFVQDVNTRASQILDVVNDLLEENIQN